ncbi:MAG: PQQ-dependent sugar dehydrogenase [Bryobacterales bacterium]|nr:PQQ-dependent sugar dehydrogenase [Bryobacterales bacterium]
MRRTITLGFSLGLMFLALAPAQHGPETVIRGTKRFQKRVVVSGLAGPWEVTWGPDQMLWVTERAGKRIVRVNPATGERKVAITIDEVSAPGGQDGLQGMALHPGLLKGSGNDFVYAAYTYVDKNKTPDSRVGDPRSPYRQLFTKIVRMQYNRASETLSAPTTLVSGMPAGNDHNAMRLKFGPDSKLYMTLGDQGNNQLGNFCHPVLAQRLPTAAEVKASDFAAYEGKSLRFNLDGSVPADNPRLDGVVSHVYTYGHRNPQGLDFGPDGTLYSSEHGPKTDDEVNVLVAGGNYGWPNVAGMRDNNAYEFARWAEAKTPCSELRFSDLAIHPAVPREAETAFAKPMVSPLATMFTVPTGFNFEDPKCKGINYICWPTVGVSGVEFYGGFKNGIPGWDAVLLITTLKRGSLYIQPLSADRKKAAGYMHRYFQSENRFRDTAVSPDGRTIFLATDPGGLAESATGGVTTNMEDKGAIVAFTYLGEGDGKSPAVVSSAARPSTQVAAKPLPAETKPAGAVAPVFSAQQVAAGKKAYESYCAVCHGNTMTNGTFGTPLAGEYFRGKWMGHSVGTLYDKSRDTMPPASPASLPKDAYANIVAYILEFNGYKAGAAALPPGGEALKKMWLE